MFLSLVLIASLSAASLPPTAISLPGNGRAGMDYFALDPVANTLWIPGGNRGETYVFDLRAKTFQTVAGFPTRTEGERVFGPTSAAVGTGAVFIGNRATREVCGYDAKTHVRRGCLVLSSPPDGLASVAGRHELWVTTPRTHSLQILDVSNVTPKLLASLTLPGDPEGYAVDEAGGRFFTNLEDADRTLAIDLRTRKTLATWSPQCGDVGPRGLAFDAATGHLVVACGAGGAVVLDAAHGGKELGRAQTGGGVDEPALDRTRHELLLASGKDATLTRLTVADSGALTVASVVATGEGCRTVYVDRDGTAYLPDNARGRLLVAKLPPATAR